MEDGGGKGREKTSAPSPLSSISSVSLYLVLISALSNSSKRTPLQFLTMLQELLLHENNVSLLRKAFGSEVVRTLVRNPGNLFIEEKDL